MNLFLFDQNSDRNIYYNLALEESISINLTNSEFSGGLRFWKNESSIVLGLSEKIQDCVNSSYISDFLKKFSDIHTIKHNKNLEPFIARRASGGGTVFHDLNSNFNFSFFISLEKKPELYPISNSYQILLSLVSDSLHKQGIKTSHEGKSDLAIVENGVKKKFSGNAQFRKKNCLVHHGTILINTDIIEKIKKYLPHPKSEPDYREKREHKDFLTSLPKSFSVEKFKTDLFWLFTEYMGDKNTEYRRENSISRERIFLKSIFQDRKRLYLEKYLNRNFIFGDLHEVHSSTRY
ncbi:MAG: lipoate--protein ligase family protein [Leptospiraceae bacterium]|nr:lipoate--protein ligase family protein [Leptospiraceae bacterium]